jgi:large subunit ribosomal protein L33
MADRITLTVACTTCKNRNYHYSRGKRKDYKIEVKKFCKKCKTQTPHKETKSSS